MSKLLKDECQGFEVLVHLSHQALYFFLVNVCEKQIVLAIDKLVIRIMPIGQLDHISLHEAEISKHADQTPHDVAKELEIALWHSLKLQIPKKLISLGLRISRCSEGRLP